MRRYSAILSAVQDTVWAIAPEKMDGIIGLLEIKAAGMSVDAATLEAVAARNRTERKPSVQTSVGVLPVVGVISQRMDMLSEFSGGVSTERLGRDFDELVNDSSVTAIVLDIDSPGGNYAGTPEIAERIYQARGKKPIVAQVNSMAGSAAFWIAAATDEIAITPSGDIGSHGVLAVHYDFSAANEQDGRKVTYVHYGQFKMEFNEDQPLSEEAHAELQRRVNEAGTTFTTALAKYRGIPDAQVLSDFGQGRMFGATEAIHRGMADRIDTLDATIARLASNRSGQSRRRAEMARRRLTLARY